VTPFDGYCSKKKRWSKPARISKRVLKIVVDIFSLVALDIENFNTWY
jgi:hypothetical protein